MPQQIILRKGTATAWTSANPTLVAGEPGYETDTGKFKIGNGTSAWNSLPYAVGTIPVNLSDLADVTSDTPSTGQVLKWNGTAWAPAADDTGGGGGGGATTLDELNDVLISGTPSSGQVLRFNGTIWSNDTLTDNNTTYTLSAETSASAAKIRLTPSTGSVDEVRFAGSSGVTVSRVDADNISIAGTTYNVTA